jgi:hypothetical protein
LAAGQGPESRGATLGLSRLPRRNGSMLTSASSRSSPSVASVSSVVAVESFGLASTFAGCHRLTRRGMDWPLCSRKRDIVFYPDLPVFCLGLRVVEAVFCGWPCSARREGFGCVLGGRATNCSRTGRSCDWRFFDAWETACLHRLPWCFTGLSWC